MPEYHAWTHLPKEEGGTDPIPHLAADSGYPSVYREISTTPQSVPGNSSGVILAWETVAFENGGETYFTTHPTTPDLHTRIIGTDKWVIEFHAQIKWEDAFNSWSYIIFDCGAFGWFPVVPFKEPYGANGNPERGDVSGVGSFERKMPTGTSDFTVQVCHENALSQNLESAWMRLAFKKVYEGTPETAL